MSFRGSVQIPDELKQRAAALLEAHIEGKLQLLPPSSPATPPSGGVQTPPLTPTARQSTRRLLLPSTRRSLASTSQRLLSFRASDTPALAPEPAPARAASPSRLASRASTSTTEAVPDWLLEEEDEEDPDAAALAHRRQVPSKLPTID